MSVVLATVYTMGINVSAVEISISRDIEQNIVKGTVTTGTNTAYTPVLIQTINEDGETVYMNQLYTDSEGRTTFEYVHKTGNAGSGIMTVTAKNENSVNSATYNQASQSEIDTILQTVKTECAKDNPDESLLKGAYIPNSDKLELDLTLYNALADGNGAEDIVFSYIAADTANKTQIQTITDVIEALYAGVAVARINKTKSASDVLALMADNKYVNAFNLDSIPKDSEGVSVLDGLATEVKTKVFERLAASNIVSASDLATKLAMYTLTEGLRYGDWTNVNKLITAYKNEGLLNVSMTTYSGLSNKGAVDKLMVNTEYTDYTAVANRFGSMVDAQYNVEHPQYTPKPQVSGGGGGGRDFTVVTTHEDETAKEEETTIPEADANGVLLSGEMVFLDMESAKWAIEPVEALYRLGIINGTGKDFFEPNRGISRAEFAKILVCMTETPLDTDENVFSDVAAGVWYYKYACAAFKAGLVSGDEEGRFYGNKIITREEMAAMIHRVMKIIGISPAESDVLGFDDDELIGGWAKESVNYLKRTGVVNGRSKNFYEPKAELSRAEAAAVVYKVLNLG